MNKPIPSENTIECWKNEAKEIDTMIRESVGVVQYPAFKPIIQEIQNMYIHNMLHAWQSGHLAGRLDIYQENEQRHHEFIHNLLTDVLTINKDDVQENQ